MERQEVDYKTEEIQKTMLVCDNCSAEVGFKEEGASLKDVYFDPEFTVESLRVSDLRPYADRDWRNIGSIKFDYDPLRRGLDSFPTKISHDGKEEWCKGCVESRDLKSGTETYNEEDDSRLPIPDLDRDQKLVMSLISVLVTFFVGLASFALHPLLGLFVLCISVAFLLASVALM